LRITEYNTDINIIGSIADLELIINIIRENGSKGKSPDSFSLIRTQKSKDRILNGVHSAFLSFISKVQENLIKDFFNHQFNSKFYYYILFLQFNVTNKLFFELNRDVLIKAIRAGKLSLNIELVVGYIYEIRERNNLIHNWSENTVITIAQKYLSFLKKLGFIEKNRTNELIYFIPTEQMIIAFIYFMNSIDQKNYDLLKNKYIDLLFLETSSVIEIIKTIKLKEYFNIATTGGSLVVELKYNFNEVVDALSNGFKTKI